MVDKSADKITGNDHNPQALYAPGVPEGLFSGLERFPNITTDRIPVGQSSYSDFKNKLDTLSKSLGRKPNLAVLCHSGIYRSEAIAQQLLKDGTANITRTSFDPPRPEVEKGIAVRDLMWAKPKIDEEGFSAMPYLSPSDVLVLALSADLTGNRSSVSQFSQILGAALEKSSVKPPLSVIWLDGTEEEFEKWLPPKDTSRPLIETPQG